MWTLTDLPWVDAKNQYGEPWKNLVQSADINPSLLPDWIECAADAAGIVQSLRVFLATDAGEIIGIIPYYVHIQSMMGLPVKIVEFAGNIISYHQEIITRSQHKELLASFLQHPAVQGWDMMCLSGVQMGGVTQQIIAELVTQFSLTLIAYPGESSPYMTIDGSWEEYINKKSKKFRYKIKKREKELCTSSDFSIRWFESQKESAYLLADVLKIEAASWKVKSNMDITGRPMELRYHERLLPMMGRESLLFANVLYIRSEPAAYNLCYRWNQRLGQIKTSFDDKFRELSPGALVLESALRRAFSDGYREFDFLGDVMRHKMTWSTASRSHETFFLFGCGAKARTLGLLKKYLQKAKNLHTRLTKKSSNYGDKKADDSE